MNPLLRHPCGGVHGPRFILGRISRFAQSRLKKKIHDGFRVYGEVHASRLLRQQEPSLLHSCNLVFNKPFKRVNVRISVYRLYSRRNFFNESVSPRSCVELGSTTHSLDGFGDTVGYGKTFVRNLFFGVDETPAPSAMVPS